MLKRVVLLILIGLFSYVEGVCCSCVGKGKITVKDFNSYDLIFVGTLINEIKSKYDEPNSDKYAYQYRRRGIYKIISAYKGVTVGDTVSVYDAQDGGACGLGRLAIGRDYLIYTYTNGNRKNQTSDCSRTTRVPIQIWPSDSAAINMLKALKSFGRIYDTTRTNFHADTPFLNKHILKTHSNTVQKFYDEAGNLSAEGKYVNGKPEGFWKYFKNGEIKSSGKYINGEKDSLWSETDFYFGPSLDVEEYNKGEFTYKEKSFLNGQISRKCEPIENGRRWIEYDYHSNGQPRFIAYATPPKRNQQGILEKPEWYGPFTMFNRAGIILQEGRHGAKGHEGRWKYYYEKGQLRMEGDYIDGEKSGLWKIYYPNGRTKAEGLYKNDQKTGIWKYFDKSGKEISPGPTFIEEDEDWFTYSGVKKY